MKKVIVAVMLAGLVGSANAGSYEQDAKDLANCATFGEAVLVAYKRTQTEKDAIANVRREMSSKIVRLAKDTPGAIVWLSKYVNDVVEVARLLPPGMTYDEVFHRSQMFCFMTDVMK